ncbi:helix-turn-helix domain-containing protein [Enterococcus nangangensis]|uniref:helix-turn-helix domain-containing protein n=1 Tax=Enterococcus nangangensis TaxID=2559926 RepID=UPI0010F59DA3|nr:helix-turn-helix transcriptional regulator [Enterococcus nangangensis]
MSIGQNIKSIRKKRNLTQKEFAKILEISNSYMSELESDKRNLSIDTINKIAKKLNVPTMQLLTQDAETNKAIEIAQKILESSTTMTEEERDAMLALINQVSI